MLMLARFEQTGLSTGRVCSGDKGDDREESENRQQKFGDESEAATNFPSSLSPVSDIHAAWTAI